MLAYILSLKPNIMAIRNGRNFELVKLFLIFFGGWSLRLQLTYINNEKTHFWTELIWTVIILSGNTSLKGVSGCIFFASANQANQRRLLSGAHQQKVCICEHFLFLQDLFLLFKICWSIVYLINHSTLRYDYIFRKEKVLSS